MALHYKRVSLAVLSTCSHWIMPSAAKTKHLVSLVSLVILVVSLGAARTSIGLIQTNTNNVGCKFFILTAPRANISTSLTDCNVRTCTCKLSVATAAIATICLAMLTVIELISVAFKTHVKV